MNSSIYSADRATHLRILVAALVGSIAMVGVALSVRLGAFDVTSAIAGAGRPLVAAPAPGRQATTMRLTPRI